MDPNKVIKELKETYSGKPVVQNPGSLREVICELEPSSKHPGYSVAVAVFDAIDPHVHKNSAEVYEVIKGEMVLIVDGQKFNLKAGDKKEIKPGQVHAATGKETWIKVRSQPGWQISDHILVQEK